MRRDPGRGTFVAEPPTHRRANFLMTFSHEMRRQGRVPTSRIIRRLAAPADGTGARRPAGGTRRGGRRALPRAPRRRRAGGAGDRRPGTPLRRRGPAGRTSRRARSTRRSSAPASCRRAGKASIGAEAASQEDAAQLGVRPGEPMLVERRLILDQRGRPAGTHRIALRRITLRSERRLLGGGQRCRHRCPESLSRRLRRPLGEAWNHATGSSPRSTTGRPTACRATWPGPATAASTRRPTRACGLPSACPRPRSPSWTRRRAWPTSTTTCSTASARTWPWSPAARPPATGARSSPTASTSASWTNGASCARVPSAASTTSRARRPCKGVISAADVTAFAWPDPQDPGRFAGMAERARHIREVEHRAVFVGSLCAGVTEMHFRLRGYEDGYMDLAADPALARQIMEKVTELKLAYWEKVLDEFGDLIDIAARGRRPGRPARAALLAADLPGDRQAAPRRARQLHQEPLEGALLPALLRRHPGPHPGPHRDRRGLPQPRAGLGDGHGHGRR